MKTKIYSLTVLLLLSLSSCKKDLLITVPNDRVSTEVFWNNENDANLAVTAAYPYLDGHARLMLRDAFTDIGHVNEFYTIPAFVEQNLFDASNATIAEEWAFAYKGIATCNYVLDNIGRVPVTDANTSILKQYTAEAKALRAYHYIKLAALFGDVPLVTKSLTIAEAKQLVRTPVAEVYNFVEAELNDASAGLPLTYGAAQKGRITKGAALALLARADLYAGRFDKAAAAAKAVMDQGTYSIYPEYARLFSYGAESNAEVILERQYLKDVLSHNFFGVIAPYSVNGTTSPVPNAYVPTKKLVEMYTMVNGLNIENSASGFNPLSPYSNRDPRLGYSVYLPGDMLPNNKPFNPNPNSGTQDAVGSTFYATSTGFTVQKYVDAEDLNSRTNSGLNAILIRYAEVLLTYAEAKVELNQIDESVLNAINQVRRRGDVNMPPVAQGLSQNALREFIRRERTVELAFEGHRLFDIRRWKIAESVVPGKVMGMSYLNESNQLQTIEVPSFNKAFSVTKNYLWPIPENEIILNPNLSQNPGW